MDLTEVSPLVGLETEGFTVGQAAFKAASNKIVKYEKTFSDNQYTFIPFVFNIFDFLTQHQKQ